MPRSRFIGRVALQKTIRSINTKQILTAVDPVYKRQSKKIRTVARRNAFSLPKATGKMASRIQWVGKSNPRIGKGSLATYTVYSNSVQDMVTTYGTPNRTLNGRDATLRSRTINGKRHRLKAGYNYTKARQKTKTGKTSKKLPIGKDGRPWAFGFRKPKPFMTENQTFERDINKMADEIGTRILRNLGKTFDRNIKLSRV